MPDRTEHIRVAIAKVRKCVVEIEELISEAEIAMSYGKPHLACSHLVCAGIYADSVTPAAKLATKTEAELLAKEHEEGKS